MRYKFRVTTNKDKIIKIKNKYDEMVSYFFGIDIGVIMASRKTIVKEKAIHFGIPSLRRFLKLVEGFLKVKYNARFIINISRRFFHLNFLLQITMSECILDIHLMNL